MNESNRVVGYLLGFANRVRSVRRKSTCANGKPRRHKQFRIQRLEDRRLLVAEGEVFDVSRAFDTTGLAGSLTSTIRWGDGTETSGQVSGAVDNDGPLRVRFEYVGSFFNDTTRRNLLNAAATPIIERFGDDLAAISPGGILQWEASTKNPTTGGDLDVPNLSVGANEFVIYVGARDLPSNQVGVAGPGGWSFPGGSFTQDQIDQILAFRDVVRYRGESGAELTNPTDYAPWGGFISFDTTTDWYFGNDETQIGANQVDFISVASHELLHVMGFGARHSSRNSSFETYAPGATFNGPKATALYGGPVPLADASHLSQDIVSRGQVPLTSPVVPRGQRLTITPLDVAVMDDLGYDVRPAPTATVTATHTYSDNPATGNSYPIEVVLRGSQAGSVTDSLSATVTNVNPTLQVAEPQEVTIGDALNVANIGMIEDPGFSFGDSQETFTYTINWGDGSPEETGNATTDRNGSSNTTTLASFNGSHLYESIGTYTVRISVSDDDGGTATGSFATVVNDLPTLQVQVDSTSVFENDGTINALITRGGDTTQALNVSLESSDSSEVTVAATVQIPASSNSVSAVLTIVDDALFDGQQTASVTFSAPGHHPTDVLITVNDHEVLGAQFSRSNVRENDPNSAKLTVSRSSLNDSSPLSVSVSQSPSIDLGIPTVIEIPAGQESVVLDVMPVDNDTYQLAQEIAFSFTAGGHDSASASIDLLDDEPPKFQNQQQVQNVNDDENGVTPLDALLIINELALQDGSIFLNPSGTQEHFFDVNGDYFITPLDALLVINFLAAAGNSEFAQAESVTPQNMFDAALAGFLQQDDDDERLVHMSAAAELI